MRVQSSLLIFKLASFTCIFLICLASWIMYTQIQYIQQIELQLNKLKLVTTHVVGVQNRYIQERRPELISDFDMHFYQFEKTYADMASLLIDMPEALKKLNLVEDGLIQLKNDLKRFEQFQIKLGYEEDEGIYGLFRQSAHQLQENFHSSEINSLELKVLELRRAEKDYLLRHEYKYLQLHEALFKELQQQLEVDNTNASTLLTSYRQGFLSYIAILSEIGLNYKEGLRGQLEQLKKNVASNILGLSDHLILQEHDFKQAWILTLLSLIIFICSTCFVLMMFLHSKVSHKINKIASVLDDVIEFEDFKLRTNLNRSDELGQIGCHIDKLLEYLDGLLQRLASVQKRLLEDAEVASFSNIIERFTQELNIPFDEVKSGKGDLVELIAILKSNLTDELDENATISEMITHLEKTLDIIESNLNISEQLIDELRVISTSQHVDTLTEFNLLNQIEYVFRNNESVLPMSDYEVIFDIPKNLLIKSYPSAINQIINLSIQNSIKHGKVNNQKLNILVSAMVVNDFVHIYFKDNGFGIDKDVLPVIFEPFFTSKRHHGGTGLGMSIIYNLVTQKLGGEVKMQSPAHGGACLHIILSETEFVFENKKG